MTYKDALDWVRREWIAFFSASVAISLVVINRTDGCNFARPDSASPGGYACLPGQEWAFGIYWFISLVLGIVLVIHHTRLNGIANGREAKKDRIAFLHRKPYYEIGIPIVLFVVIFAGTNFGLANVCGTTARNFFIDTRCWLAEYGLATCDTGAKKWICPSTLKNSK